MEGQKRDSVTRYVFCPLLSNFGAGTAVGVLAISDGHVGQEADMAAANHDPA